MRNAELHLAREDKLTEAKEMISVKMDGDFSKTKRYLMKSRSATKKSVLDKYGRKGVEALSFATPRDTGETAGSWDYTIIEEHDLISLIFTNSNAPNNVPIAIMLQYGHAVKNGGWVEGRDYINPAIQPLFDKLANDVWEEVCKV